MIGDSINSQVLAADMADCSVCLCRRIDEIDLTLQDDIVSEKNRELVRGLHLCPELIKSAIHALRIQKTTAMQSDVFGNTAMRTSVGSQDVTLDALEQEAEEREYTFGARVRDPIWEIKDDATTKTPPRNRQHARCLDLSEVSGAATKRKNEDRRDAARHKMRPAVLDFGNAESCRQSSDRCKLEPFPPASPLCTEKFFVKITSRWAAILLILLITMMLWLQRPARQESSEFAASLEQDRPQSDAHGPDDLNWNSQSERRSVQFPCDAGWNLNVAGEDGGGNDANIEQEGVSEGEGWNFDGKLEHVEVKRDFVAVVAGMVRRAMIASLLATASCVSLLFVDWLLFV